MRQHRISNSNEHGRKGRSRDTRKSGKGGAERATFWMGRASYKPEEALSKRSPFGESRAAFVASRQRIAKGEKDPVTFYPKNRNC